MKKIPAFRIYGADFLAHTAGLTDAQVGKIIRALCKKTMGHPEGILPDVCAASYKFLSDLQNDDIEKYKAKILQKQRAAGCRWNADADADAMRMECQPQPQPQPQDISKDISKGGGKKFIIPDWIDEKVWHDFEAMRKRIKAPMTDAARFGIVSKLEKLRDKYDCNSILNESVIRSWRGVFEPKEEVYANTTRNTGGTQNAGGIKPIYAKPEFTGRIEDSPAIAAGLKLAAMYAAKGSEE